MKLQINAAKLSSAIADGRGRGVGDEYTPWIQIRRSTSSPFSNQSIWRLPGMRRASHFLSRGEREIATIVSFAGATDIREQYPLFAWPHPHPADEIHGVHSNSPHIGMERIAAEAGIKLTHYPRTKIPVVLTIDLMVTFPERDTSKDQLLGISCKPRQGRNGGYPLRVLERLELDRRYCARADIRHLLLHPEMFPRDLSASLTWISPDSHRNAWGAIRKSSTYLDFVDRVGRKAYERPPYLVVEKAATRLSIPSAQAGDFLKIALWTQDLDVDLNCRLSMSSPFRPGGRAMKTLLASMLFGRRDA